MREIKFKPAPDFPKYEIGNDGSVFSLDYNNSGQRKKMKQYLDDDGYPYVIFTVGRRRFKRIIHRMIAILFVKNEYNKPQVNHKDGVRSNNKASNLEWVTAQENTIHGYRVNGRTASVKSRDLARDRFSGTKNPKAKLNEAELLSIRRLRSKGWLLKDIAERVGISIAQVGQIANNKFWKP